MTELERERPLELPVIVPPKLVTPIWLSAKAANGRASARTASNTTFLNMNLLPPRKVLIVRPLGGVRDHRGLHIVRRTRILHTRTHIKHPVCQKRWKTY